MKYIFFIVHSTSAPLYVGAEGVVRANCETIKMLLCILVPVPDSSVKDL
jgi:hypothetical protein